MGRQEGDIGELPLGRRAAPTARCRCGNIYILRASKKMCRLCETEEDERRREQAIIEAAKRRRAQVEAARKQRRAQKRSMKVYRPVCTCGREFATTSKTRQLCNLCRKNTDYSSKLQRARERGIGFDLTEEQFASFQAQPCRYCGAAFDGVHLDRIHSDQPYTLSNVVSCCPDCNRLKHITPPDLFREQIQRMAQHMSGEDFSQWLAEACAPNPSEEL